MKLDDIKSTLARHGVPEGSFYTHGGLGGGEIDGIEQIDGVWYTYFSERGEKNDRKAWPDEVSAVALILPGIVEQARRLGTERKRLRDQRGDGCRITWVQALNPKSPSTSAGGFRLRNPCMIQPFTNTLDDDHALVLFEALSKLAGIEAVEKHLDAAELASIDRLVAARERQRPAVHAPNYAELLAAAMTRLPR